MLSAFERRGLARWPALCRDVEAGQNLAPRLVSVLTSVPSPPGVANSAGKVSGVGARRQGSCPVESSLQVSTAELVCLGH